MSLLPTVLFALFLACATIGWSNVLHVPGDYSTIQTAFDALEIDGDTVLVEFGEYAEALNAPELPFCLMGDVEPDTGNFPRPTIDASLLPESLRGPCLTLPSGSFITVEKIRFRNRNGMTPFADVGGVDFLADSAIFRRCAFDSLYCGICLDPDHVAAITVENCVFREDSIAGIYAENATVLAVDCLFDGGWGWAGLHSGSNSIIEGCTFRNRSQYLLSNVGHGRITNCVFGPSQHEVGFPPVELIQFSGEVENCVFSNIILGTGVLWIEAESTHLTTVSGNSFLGNRTISLQGHSSVVLDGDCAPGVPIIFEDNIVMACSTSNTGTKALDVRTCAYVANNRFVANEPLNRWTVMNWDPDSVLLRHNIISENGSGVRNFASSGTIDARQNWWGHATGPYNAFQNPFGQGDSVSNNVLFAPWTADTNDWLNVEEAPLIPKSFAIEVFPNPFNSSATMLLRVPDPTIIQVELFDMLGRRVKEIWSGAVAIEKKIHVDAHELPSGIYFARATEVHFRRPLATAKLLLIR